MIIPNAQSVFERAADTAWIAEGVSYDHGWYHSAEPIWSRSPIFGILAKVPTGAPGDHGGALLVTFVCFGATAKAPRRMTVTVAGHEPIRWLLRDHGPYTIQFPAPSGVPGTMAPISFEVDPISSPFALKQSTDDRLLGIRLLGISHLAATMTPTVEFRDPGTNSPILGRGWVRPDGHGTWSAGSTATLHLPHRIMNVGLGPWVTFDTLPRPWDAAPLEIEMSIGDATMTLASAGGEHRVSLESLRSIPTDDDHDASALRPDMTVRIGLGGLLSPKDLGLSIDDRPLGIRLQRIDWNA